MERLLFVPPKREFLVRLSSDGSQIIHGGPNFFFLNMSSNSNTKNFGNKVSSSCLRKHFHASDDLDDLDDSDDLSSKSANLLGVVDRDGR